jgi:hypothetical protein
MAFTPTEVMTLISAALAAPAASNAAKPIAVDFTACFIVSPHVVFGCDWLNKNVCDDSTGLI